MEACDQRIDAIGEAATRDLIVCEEIPAHLQGLLASDDPMVAQAAFDAADELQSAQSIRWVWLGPLEVRAARYPHWWVRWRVAGLLERRVPPVRLYSRLFADPVAAVAVEAVTLLVLVPVATAVRLLKPLHSKRRRLLLTSLRLEAERAGDDRLAPLHAQLLAAFPDDGEHTPFLDSRETRAEKLLAMPADAVVLALSYPGGKVPLRSYEAVAASHPSAMARRAALERWVKRVGYDDTRFHRALRQAARDPSPFVRLAVARLLGGCLSEKTYRSLGSTLLALTFDPCLPVVQAAARALRESGEAPGPPRRVVRRLCELAQHPDALVRVNAYYSLQHFWEVGQTLTSFLLRRFEAEPEPRVRAAIAETGWWVMPPDTWAIAFASYLVEGESGRWRGLARDLLAWSADREGELEAIIAATQNTAVRRLGRRIRDRYAR